MRTTLIIPPLAVLALTSMTTQADPPPSHTVEMEIVDVPKTGQAHIAKFAMAIVENRGWFSTNSHDGTAALKLMARLDRDAASNLTLQLGVERHGSNDFDVNAAKVVAPQPIRSLMSRVDRDTGSTEIFATVR